RALLAVGPPTDRVELAAALEEARLLVDLGRQLWLRGTVSAEDFLPELLLARSPRIGAVVRRRAIGPLEAYAEGRGGDLLDTLEAFAEGTLERPEAAAQLAKVEELTGLSVERPRDLLLIQLALKQRALESVR
ncbi:MAG: hypothetical protein H0V29_08080, partial [Thermoleophilaceae bacterium]|nr:hypothetical protein [Thermoleophilaceae bacterium]